jgi:hypothetical protein
MANLAIGKKLYYSLLAMIFAPFFKSIVRRIATFNELKNSYKNLPFLLSSNYLPTIVMNQKMHDINILYDMLIVDLAFFKNIAAIFLRVESVFLFFANVFLLLGRYLQHVFFHGGYL